MSTIVAPSTPIGRGTIAIIRLSGDRALTIATTLCFELDHVKARRATLGQIRYPDTGETLDEVLITYFQKPHSVIQVKTLLRSVVTARRPLFARFWIKHFDWEPELAEPGEFSLRAVQNGKINLAQAEAIEISLPRKLRRPLSKLRVRLGGELSKRLEQFEQRLIKVIVLFESALEFVEDDLPATEMEAVEALLRSTKAGVNDLGDTFTAGRLLQDGLKVAIVGSPNVGKSSLFQSTGPSRIARL